MKKDAARDALVQEARELIVAMEAALLEIESEGRSKATINAIFRAAHTIKGSAGLFAFDSIVSFTHLLENVLDKVRNNILQLNEGMMSLLLNCGDYMDTLVDAIAEFKENEDPDPVLRAELEAVLNAYLASAAASEASAESPLLPGVRKQARNDAEPELDISTDINVVNPFWHLSLRFSPDMLRNGLDPMSFLRYLLTMGTAVYLHLQDSAMPSAQEMDPELCYLGIELGLDSAADQVAIENVFEFVREDSQIIVLPPHAALDDYRRWLTHMPDRDSLAQMLLKEQTLTHAEWQLLTLGQVAEALPAGAVSVLRETLQTRPAYARSGEEKKAHEQKFIKIEVSKLDQLIDLVGELVIAGAGASLVAKQKKDRRFDEATQTISTLVEQIRDSALSLRMVQINEVFQRFPRVVRDMSREIGKKIELFVTGAETELDKSMVEKISDPLVHIVRNAMDHGIESAAERRAVGKPEMGVLRLNAMHESGSVVIEVLDDGRGLDKEKILRKAIEQGFIGADAMLTENEIFRFIFEPGFSTAEKVTALSGRGVGMDVVKRNIDSLQGEVTISSKHGQGTMVRIRLPLTLAIIAGFQVAVGAAVFVIPLDLVVECINLSVYPVHQNVITLRGEPLPFIVLRELFELPLKESSRKSLVVVQSGRLRAGLLVDNLLGECQAVIKPLGKLFSKVKGISGSTILGDGRVALILDVPHLISQSEKGAQATDINAEVLSDFGLRSGNQA